MIVADTNLIAYLLIEGEKTESARHVWRRDSDWAVPPLWRSEFLSVLSTSARAGVIDDGQAITLWRYAISLFGHREKNPDGEDVLAFAIDLDISAYDAQFAVLAHTNGLTLVTADKKLCRACPDIAIPIEKFAAGS